jgi:hypothetical protein
MVGGGWLLVAANSSLSSRALSSTLPDITDQWWLVTAILACLSGQIWSKRGPMPGISGGYSFRGERLPVDWFGGRFGDAIEADAGCTKRFSVIRKAMIRPLFLAEAQRLYQSLLEIVSRGKKFWNLIVCN